MLKVYRPDPDLMGWVQGGVVVELGSNQTHSCFPAMPQGMLTVRWQARADATPVLVQPPTFHTLSSQPMVHAHAGGGIALGLVVSSAAAATLLGASVGTMTNASLDWRWLAGDAEADRLTADLLAAPTHRHCLSLLQASFRRAAVPVVSRDHAGVTALYQAIERFGAQAGDQVGLGRRQLERRCLATFGLSPKSLQRLLRFHQALAMAVQLPRGCGAGMAADAGYFDQSHLARDARAFAGVSMQRLVESARPQSPWWSVASGRSLRSLAGRWQASVEATSS